MFSKTITMSVPDQKASNALTTLLKAGEGVILGIVTAHDGGAENEFDILVVPTRTAMKRLRKDAGANVSGIFED